MHLLYEFDDATEYMPCQSFELKDSKYLKRKGRCSSFIFPAKFNDNDIEQINEQVRAKLCGIRGLLNLYVTGTAPELLAVTKYCFENNISLVVWHYDEEHCSYYPQAM